MSHIGLVVGGGGAKGAFSVGVLKRLVNDKKIKFNVGYGTSVGALTVTALSFGGIEKLEKIWLDIGGLGDLFNFQWSSLLLQTSAIYSPEPLKEIVTKVIKDGKPSFDVYAVVTSMNTGTIQYIHHSHPDFINFVVASTCIPAVLEPYKDTKGEVWADGGLRELVPLSRSVTDHCTDLHVIFQSPTDYGIKPLKKGFISSVIRAVDIITHDVLRNDMIKLEARNLIDGYRQINCNEYKPDQLLLDVLDFKPELIKKAIKQGEDSVR